VRSHLLPTPPPQLINVVTIPPETCIKFASTSSGVHQGCPKSVVLRLWTGVTSGPINVKFHYCKRRRRNIPYSGVGQVIDCVLPVDHGQMSDISWTAFWGPSNFICPLSKINSSSLTRIFWINLPMQRSLPSAEDI
jgi:hypothetical protein